MSMDFEEALQDIFFIPRIMGSFPFDYQFRLSKKLLAYCCLVKFVTAFGTTWTFINPTSQLADGDEDFFNMVLRFASAISNLTENLFSIVWWIIKRHKVTFLMKTIDEMQKREKITLERKKIRFIHFLLLLTLSTCFLSYYSDNANEKNLSFIFSHFHYFLALGSTKGFVGQFWDILHYLGNLFRESTQLYDENSVINYGRFLAISETVNEIYGLQLLYTTTQLFLQIVVCLYVLFLPLFPGLIIQNLVIFSIVLNCVVPIGSIILACNYFTKQERNFNDDLRRRMIDENSKVLLKNEKLSFHFLAVQETVFTAYGYFNIDLSLICSMVSVAATYLLIVLEYGSERLRMQTTIFLENTYNSTESL